MVFVCMAGVLIGDSLIFMLGAKYGREITKKPFFNNYLSLERLETVKQHFQQKGNKVIFAARFMPGLRAPTFFSAATLHLPFSVFFFYDGMAALISVPAIVWTVYHFGALADQVIEIIRHIEHGIVFLVIGVICIILGKTYLKNRASATADTDESQ
jgi:membrane protein DedA with SNARE-associated domain